MLLLLFYIGENLYAIDTDQVVEIVPMVLLRRIQSSSEAIAGVLNYHGKIVPVVDLCRLLQGVPCQVCYRTRLIMVGADSYANSHTGQTFRLDRRQCQLGLIAERVTETIKISPDISSNVSNNLSTNISQNITQQEKSNSDSPYIGELFLTEKGIVQKLNWGHLVSDGLAALPQSMSSRPSDGEKDERNFQFPRRAKEQGNSAGHD